MLVGGVLSGDAVDPERARGAQLGEVIAKAARLRRAATRPGDLVPAVGQRDARAAGHRVHVEHRAAGTQGAEVDL